MDVSSRAVEPSFPSVLAFLPSPPSPPSRAPRAAASRLNPSSTAAAAASDSAAILRRASVVASVDGAESCDDTSFVPSSRYPRVRRAAVGGVREIAQSSALIIAAFAPPPGLTTDARDAPTDPTFAFLVADSDFFADDVSAARSTEAETAGGARGVEEERGRPRDASTAARSAASTSAAILPLALGVALSRANLSSRPCAVSSSALAAITPALAARYSCRR